MKIGERAAFKLPNGTILLGKIIQIRNGVYHVIGSNCEICTTFADGLFRFNNSDVVTNENSDSRHQTP